MPQARSFQSSFTAGEWSPKLIERSDLSTYRSAVAELLNMISEQHGPAARRPGTQFVAEIKFPHKTGTRLHRFDFSASENYTLEFGDLYVRFYRDGAQMTFSGSPTEKTLPYADSELAALKFTQSADVLYIMHPLYETRTLSRGSGDDADPATWTVATYGATDGPYLAENITATTLDPDGTTGSIGVVASAVTGINGGDGFLSTDVGRIIRLQHPSTTAAGWMTITAVTNTTTLVCTVEATLPSLAASTRWRLGAWSDTTGWPQAATFHQQRLWFGATTAQLQALWASVTGDFANHAPTDIGDVTIVLETAAMIFTIDADEVNAIEWLLSDARGLIPATAGGIFSNAGDPKIAITPSQPLLPVFQDPARAHPTARPQKAPGVILLTTTGGRQVREIRYDFAIDRFISPDLTVLSEHITGENGITETAYQQLDRSILWSVRSDGVLLGMTYERLQQVLAWHRHKLGGALGGYDHAFVESITVLTTSGEDQLWMLVARTIDGATRRYIEFMQQPLPRDAHQEDAWHLDCALTIDDAKTITGASVANPVVITAAAHGLNNGDTVRIRDVLGMTEINDRSFTVSSATGGQFELADEDGSAYTAYAGAGEAHKEITAITGLSHLEGETVGVLADGAEFADAVVSGGAITLASKASRITVGYRYSHRLKTMPVLPPPNVGEAQGMTIRIAVVTFWLDRTLGGSYGADETSMTKLDYRQFQDSMDVPTELFTGVAHRLVFPSTSSAQATVVLEGDTPLPFNVLGIACELEVS